MNVHCGADQMRIEPVPFRSTVRSPAANSLACGMPITCRSRPAGFLTLDDGDQALQLRDRESEIQSLAFDVKKRNVDIQAMAAGCLNRPVLSPRAHLWETPHLPPNFENRPPNFIPSNTQLNILGVNVLSRTLFQKGMTCDSQV
jgi:hypothetical protein